MHTDHRPGDVEVRAEGTAGWVIHRGGRQVGPVLTTLAKAKEWAEEGMELTGWWRRIAAGRYATASYNAVRGDKAAAWASLFFSDPGISYFGAAWTQPDGNDHPDTWSASSIVLRGLWVSPRTGTPSCCPSIDTP